MPCTMRCRIKLPKMMWCIMQVIVLVGTGWSYMKPLLANKEKRILMIVIPLQVCAEVAIIVLDESTPASRCPPPPRAPTAAPPCP